MRNAEQAGADSNHVLHCAFDFPHSSPPLTLSPDSHLGCTVVASGARGANGIFVWHVSVEGAFFAAAVVVSANLLNVDSFDH